MVSMDLVVVELPSNVARHEDGVVQRLLAVAL
jgi:hypothetical protein